MSKRFITRIELTVPTRTKLTDVSHSNGMTQVAVLSRLVQWFAAQPDTIQAAILGRYPTEIEQDVAKLLLQRMASEKGRERVRHFFDDLLEHGDPLGEFNKFCDDQLEAIQQNLDRVAKALEGPHPG